jgi:hypothetical protein
LSATNFHPCNWRRNPGESLMLTYIQLMSPTLGF